MTAGRDEVIAEIARKHFGGKSPEQKLRAKGCELAIREAISRVGGREAEPTEEMIAAGVATFGPIVGSPERLADPVHIERQRASRERSVLAIYKAMRDAATKEG